MFLSDILESCRKIQKYTKEKYFEDLISEEMLLDALVRNLEIIGEAAKNIPTDVKDRHSHIEWRKIAGLRDYLIHVYFGIDEEILWDIVKNKIPKLQQDIKEILRHEQS
ncbi:MAG: DUF86 domain-containing protein [Calditrichaeota bacterium]|nr:MAG: DUF86 domain-containing protein [Calditrichota bacterium]